MRIALLAHCRHPIAEPYRGGLEMHTALVTRELVARGHEVTLFGRAGSQTPARLRTVVGRRHAFDPRPEIAGRAWSDSQLDRALSDALSAISPRHFDAVLNNSLSPVPYQALAGLPMLTVLHTPATLERVNAVITRPGWRPDPRHEYAAVSAYTQREWRSVLTRVSCIPNGIDLDQWTPDPGSRPDPDLAVWAARITPEKGLHVAVAAVRTAGLRLEISGPISDRAYFDEVITPLLADDVRYVGHLRHRELAAFLQRGAVFVSSPLWPEPFGLALVEAMASGTPAAALPRGAAAEVVASTGGVLATDSTVEALAAAILSATALDRGAVRASVAGFDHRAMVAAYEDVLLELAEVRIRRRHAIPHRLPAPTTALATLGAERSSPCP